MDEDVMLDDLSEILYRRGMLARPRDAGHISLILEKYLTSGHSSVRYGAVMGLSFVATKANIPVLEAALSREPDGIIRSLLQSLITLLRTRP